MRNARRTVDWTLALAAVAALSLSTSTPAGADTLPSSGPLDLAGAAQGTGDCLLSGCNATLQSTEWSATEAWDPAVPLGLLRDFEEDGTFAMAVPLLGTLTFTGVQRTPFGQGGGVVTEVRPDGTYVLLDKPRLGLAASVVEYPNSHGSLYLDENGVYGAVRLYGSATPGGDAHHYHLLFDPSHAPGQAAVQRVLTREYGGEPAPGVGAMQPPDSLPTIKRPVGPKPPPLPCGGSGRAAEPPGGVRDCVDDPGPVTPPGTCVPLGLPSLGGSGSVEVGAECSDPKRSNIVFMAGRDYIDAHWDWSSRLEAEATMYFGEEDMFVASKHPVTGEHVQLSLRYIMPALPMLPGCAGPCGEWSDAVDPLSTENCNSYPGFPTNVWQQYTQFLDDNGYDHLWPGEDSGGAMNTAFEGIEAFQLSTAHDLWALGEGGEDWWTNWRCAGVAPNDRARDQDGGGVANIGAVTVVEAVDTGHPKYYPDSTWERGIVSAHEMGHSFGQENHRNYWYWDWWCMCAMYNTMASGWEIWYSEMDYWFGGDTQEEIACWYFLGIDDLDANPDPDGLCTPE